MTGHPSQAVGQYLRAFQSCQVSEVVSLRFTSLC